MRLAERPTVAVVGGGFSGLMTALHLLDIPDGPRVRLIERRPGVGRGAAYAPRGAEQLLNVRAHSMSAWPDQPLHFVEWLKAQGTGGEAGFVSRDQYGAYLQAMLRARTQAGQAGRLLIDADAVVGVAPAGGAWALKLGMGRTIHADAVVLAIGNLPPHAPLELEPEAEASPGYVADPWFGGWAGVPEQGRAVLLGTSLTMVDVALRLARDRPGLKLLAISRRGLLPRRHLGVGPAPLPWRPRRPHTPAGVLGEFRARAEFADWRCVIDGLRPEVQSLWRSWSQAERRRFLRHLRPWWDVHRHRLAPEVASALDHLTGSGVLTVRAGRIARIARSADGLEVHWRPREATGPQSTQAAAVMNCTGPNGDLARAQDPLVVDLVDRGLVQADACRLGLEVDAEGRLVRADGRSNAGLFAVGPVTRGAYWEITSVPDIRVQAAECAAHVHRTLAGAVRLKVG